MKQLLKNKKSLENQKDILNKYLDNNIHNYASLTEPTKGTNKGIRF